MPNSPLISIIHSSAPRRPSAPSKATIRVLRYIQHEAYLNPQAVALANELRIALCTPDTPFAGLTPYMDRLVATGKDVAYNMQLWFGPYWEEGESPHPISRYKEWFLICTVDQERRRCIVIAALRRFRHPHHLMPTLMSTFIFSVVLALLVPRKRPKSLGCFSFREPSQFAKTTLRTTSLFARTCFSGSQIRPAFSRLMFFLLPGIYHLYHPHASIICYQSRRSPHVILPLDLSILSPISFFHNPSCIALHRFSVDQ